MWTAPPASRGTRGKRTAKGNLNQISKEDTQMTDMNKMLDKVQKLLALAGNNPSEEEAKAAAMKAQKLIAQYNLDLSSLSSEEKIEYKLLKAEHPNNNGYRGRLAAILAPNFRCKAVYLGTDVHFFGREGDVDTCVNVFNYLYKTMRTNGCRQERIARKEGRSAHGVANCYWLGFMNGLKDELGAQSKALAIIVPEDVKDKFTEKFPRAYVDNRMGVRHTGYDKGAYESGYTDGRNSMKKGELGA